MKKYRIISIFICIAILITAFPFASSALSEEYIPLSVYYNGKKVDTQAYSYRGTPYVQLATLKTYGDCSKLSFSESELKAYIDLSKMDISIADSETTAFIKKYAGTCYMYLKKLDGKVYVPLDTLSQFTKLAYTLNGNSLSIAPYSANRQIVKIGSNGAVAMSSMFGGLGQTVALSANAPMFMVSQTNSMYKLQDMFGDYCYVMKEDVVTSSDSASLPDFFYTAKNKTGYNKKINMVWHNIGTSTQKAPNPSKGMDVVSPVYFRQVVNGSGEVYNYASLGYTNNSHANGFDVWATVNNNFSLTGSSSTTHKIMADANMRYRSIAQYLFYCALYDVDGICVDYESFNDVKSREGFTDFIQTLAKYCNKMGIYSSVAIPPVYSWYPQFDYEAIGAACDYVCIMTYDEHYSGSTSAGSVSSKTWYTNHIDKLAQYVPYNKIMMGVPFYTRAFNVTSSGKVASSVALAMDAARNRVKNNKLNPTWNEKDGQYYVEYASGSQTVKLWFEDKRSIATRLDLVMSKGLAGTCCWELSQQESDISDVFYNIYNNGVSPSEYNKPY